MKLKREKVLELMNTYFKGNYSAFAKDIEVDITHLHRYLKKGVGGGQKLCGAIMKFCMNKGLDVQEYFVWEDGK